MNKIMRIFCPIPEEEEEDRKNLEKLKQELIERKHCLYCIHSYEVPHYEHGKYAGTDTHCSITHELRSYPEDNGQQCLFWEQRSEG